jgi:nitrogen fixation-related uncharacterized protein
MAKDEANNLMCPSCLSGGIGPGYLAAFAICILFFLIAAGAMLWASRSGQLDGLEDTKYRMLEERE